MLAVARRILRDDDEARDTLQEAFVLAFRGISRFEGQSRSRPGFTGSSSMRRS